MIVPEKNKVLRPKHIPANAHNNLAPTTGSWISDFVRINIIDRVSAQNAVDGRLSKNLSLSLQFDGKGNPVFVTKVSMLNLCQ